VWLPQDTEVLELQQQAAYRQQIQQLQQQEDEDAAQREEEATARAEAAAFAAANKAAAAAYQQQADAEAAAEAVVRRARAPPARAPAELFKFDVSLLDSDIPGHAQLMQVLMCFRHDMVEGLTGVTSTMQVGVQTFLWCSGCAQVQGVTKAGLSLVFCRYVFCYVLHTC
jgi:hypothetical protein